MAKANKLSSPRYRPNKAWDVVYENGLLVLNAGADKLFAIEDVAEEDAHTILALWKQSSFELPNGSKELATILEQLKAAGLLINELGKNSIAKIALKFIGKPNQHLAQETEKQLGKNLRLSPEKEAEFVVFIRTNAQLKNLLEDYDKVTKPHILVDISFEHSISLGPLVFPGETACLSCLVGRVTTYWGDAVPPQTPAIQNNPVIIAGLLNMELTKILFEYNRELVNHTVAFDFEEHRIKKNSVYKLPMCPVCGTSNIDSLGAIELPWLQKEAK
jgi:bacteriocin biosynthesis cyclodehydratase domain-containing protein